MSTPEDQVTTQGNPVQALDAFYLRHLTAHLVAAGRTDDLHRLLALDFIAAGTRARGTWASRLLRREAAPSPRRVNAWYDAKVAADQLAEYAADVEQAWRMAERASVQAIEADGRSPTLASELRCACIVGSLTAMGSALPVPLLAGLVDYGIWSVQQALAQVRRPGRSGHVEWTESDSLIELLRRFAESGHADVALDSARSLADPVMRAGALGAVAAPGEALAVAESIADDDRRARAVELMAPHLDSDSVAGAARLLTAAGPGGRVGWAVRSLARRMAQVGCGSLAVDLVLSPWAMDEQGGARLNQVVLCRAVEEMAQHLGPEDVRNLVDRIADPTLAAVRVPLLKALAPYLPADTIHQAMTLASGAADAHARTSIQPWLLDGDLSTLRARARGAAAEVDREDRWEVLTCIALRQSGELRHQLLRDAAAAAVRSEYSESRAEDLIAVMSHCGPALRVELFGQAMRRCRGISEQFRRSYALERLAALVDEPRRTQALHRALRAAVKSGNIERRAEIATQIGRGPVLDLLRACQTVGGDDGGAVVALRAWIEPDLETLLAADRGDVLHRSVSVVDRAAAGIVSGGGAGDALEAFAAHRHLGELDDSLAALVRQTPPELLGRAASVVQRMRPQWRRAASQAALAAALVEAGQVEDGYRWCRDLVGGKPAGGLDYEAANAVRRVAPLLAAAGRLDLALALCEACRDEKARMLARAECADHAEPEEAQRLLTAAVAAARADVYYQTELAGPLVRHGRQDEAIRIAMGSSDPVRVLARVSLYSAEPRRGEVFADARRLARERYAGSRNEHQLLTDLQRLVEVAADTVHASILSEYLAEIDNQAASSVTDYRINSTPLENALGFLSSHLAARGGGLVGYEIWRRALRDMSTYGRGRLLSAVAALAPLSETLVTQGTGHELLRTLDDVLEWWP